MMSIVPAFFNRTASIRPLFDDAGVSEIAVNGPGIVWVSRQGRRFMERVDTPVLSESTLRDFAELVAHHSDQETDATRPLLAASIPSELTGQGNRDFRIQVVQPPAVPPGTIAIAIRKPSILDLTMQYYIDSGAFDRVNEPLPGAEDTGKRLAMLHRDREWPAFLRLAVKAKKNIVVSAPTFAGKTEFINMLLKEISPHERIVTIQDALELRPPQQNVVHLVYSRGNQGTAQVTAVDLMETSLRLSPDRVIPGELRGAEAYVALEMLNSGHGGWMTTLHSESPEHMFERLAQMVMRFGSTMQRAEIIDYARGLIDVVVQMHRYDDGVRGISKVLYVPR
jgi:type IV secretion system protein VirB11